MALRRAVPISVATSQLLEIALLEFVRASGVNYH